MSKTVCDIYSRSNSAHLQQIYTGFAELHRAGAVQVTQRVERVPHVSYGQEVHLQAVVNREIKLFYDLHDGAQIDEDKLKNSHFYFKRSFEPDLIASLADKQKVFPLGLNYLVYAAENDAFLRARQTLENDLREKAATFFRSFNLDRFGASKIFAPRANRLHAPPDFTRDSKVLFMARAWNVSDLAEDADRTAIAQINETRANCIRLLRKQFGRRFYGGFSHDEFSLNYFADCLIPDAAAAQNRNYLKLLREFPICVATTGLLGSIGWKMGEYVAHSKAVASERLSYQVPGGFAAERNYLEFDSPEDAATAVEKLLTDKTLRLQMMWNNYRYYHAYLKPDALVLRTLAIALGATPKD